MPTARFHLGVGVIVDSFIWIVRGENVEVFDTKINKWTTSEAKLTPARFCPKAVSVGKRISVIGGHADKSIQIRDCS